MFRTMKLFKLFLKDRAYKRQKAINNSSLLVDCYTDSAFLQKLADSTDRVIEVFTLDNAHIIIRPKEKKEGKKIDWSRNYD